MFKKISLRTETTNQNDWSTYFSIPSVVRVIIIFDSPFSTKLVIENGRGTQ